jgi:hypothetical protein
MRNALRQTGTEKEHRQLRKKGVLHSNGKTTNKSGQLNPGVYERGASANTWARSLDRGPETAL